MREIDNSVCREMIFVLIVWPGHSRPVIKIHYLAPCSVVQANFREKIDSKLVKYCRPRKNQGAVTYTATGVAFVVRTINLSGRNGNVLGFKTMRVIGVLE